MCGIAGFLAKGLDPARARAILDRMLSVLIHRGPDDRGIEFLPGPGLGLVHARLSVIDLSPGGRQPMWSEDGTLGIVFNGEIYNFRDLRARIEKEGARFRSASDTEAILAGYAAWGDGVLGKLNGMFALAIWDARRERLFLARDRAGKKPLYYRHDPARGEFVFASEAKAILEWPGAEREVDPEALQSYLALGYVPFPHSMFRGVRKLPPAHWLAFDGRGVETGRYWSAPALGSWRAPASEYRRAIRRSVEEAVERRLVSDVPLGAFLSGGVDSSIVVGVMSRLLSEPVRTFSAAFDVGPRSFKYNVDADAAEVVSRAFGTRHTRLVVRPEEGLLDHIERAVWHMDEPHGNPTAVTTYLLARLVKKEGVTVALSGDGSDELFGGYHRYLADRWVSRAARIPRALRRPLAALARRAPGLGRAAKAFAKAELPPRSPERYFSWWQVFTAAERSAMLAPELAAAEDAPRRTVETWAGPDSCAGDQDWLAHSDFVLWIPEESNMRVDKMSMAHALEVRAPFLDYRTAELALSIPYGAKVGPREGKTLLKEAFRDLLPEVVRKRPKWGWFSPVHYWVKDLVWDEARRLVAGLPETGLFSPGVRAWVETPPPGEPLKVWNLLVFALWHKTFMR